MRARDLSRLPDESGIPRPEAVGELDINLVETGRLQRLAIGVNRNRTGDTSGPGIERGFDYRWERLDFDHIGDREPAARPQHTKGFTENRGLVRGKVDDAV